MGQYETMARALSYFRSGERLEHLPTPRNLFYVLCGPFARAKEILTNRPSLWCSTAVGRSRQQAMGCALKARHFVRRMEILRESWMELENCSESLAFTGPLRIGWVPLTWGLGAENVGVGCR